MILLLHDLQQIALAKDLKDLCAVLGVELVLLAFEPNNTPTLGAKEEKAIDQCAGAVFLVTPRDGAGTISGSVIHELGQLSKKFQKSPEKVIVMADARCEFPAVEQRPRIVYQDGDTGSVFRAVECLITCLKSAQFLPVPAGAALPPLPTPVVGAEVGLSSIEKIPGLAEVVLALGQAKNAFLTDEGVGRVLEGKCLGAALTVNIVKKELRAKDLAKRHVGGDGTVYWQLTDNGLDLARAVADEKARALTAALHKMLPGIIRKSSSA